MKEIKPHPQVYAASTPKHGKPLSMELLSTTTPGLKVSETTSSPGVLIKTVQHACMSASDHNHVYLQSVGVLRIRATRITWNEGNSSADPYLPIRYLSGAIHANSMY